MTVDRHFGVAMAALIAVLALTVAVAIAQPVAKSTTTSATSGHELRVGPMRYTGIPYPAPDSVIPDMGGRDLFNAAELARPTAAAGGINVSGVPSVVTNDLSFGTPKQIPIR
jgi:hypothetical protein